jgi:hypothetical protein
MAGLFMKTIRSLRFLKQLESAILLFEYFSKNGHQWFFDSEILKEPELTTAKKFKEPPNTGNFSQTIWK